MSDRRGCDSSEGERSCATCAVLAAAVADDGVGGAVDVEALRMAKTRAGYLLHGGAEMKAARLAPALREKDIMEGCDGVDERTLLHRSFLVSDVVSLHQIFKGLPIKLYISISVTPTPSRFAHHCTYIHCIAALQR